MCVQCYRGPVRAPMNQTSVSTGMSVGLDKSAAPTAAERSVSNLLLSQQPKQLKHFVSIVFLCLRTLCNVSNTRDIRPVHTRTKVYLEVYLEIK